MRAQRQRADERFRHQHRDTGIALLAVPVAPVGFDVAKLERQLIERRFDLLQADDVGFLSGEPLNQLTLPRADAIDVPRCDLHRLSRRSVCAKADCQWWTMVIGDWVCVDTGRFKRKRPSGLTS